MLSLLIQNGQHLHRALKSSQINLSGLATARAIVDYPDLFQKRKRPIDPDAKDALEAFLNDDLQKELRLLLIKARDESSRLLCPRHQQTSWLEEKPCCKRFYESKAHKLSLAFWLFEHLGPASHDQEALNQLACCLSFVEALARRQAQNNGWALTPHHKTMRVIRPYSENCCGQSILVSHAIAHIVIIKPCGSIQVQRALKLDEAVDYFENAQEPQGVVLTKMGKSNNLANFWDS
jgi:hypothetical protein